MLDYTTDTCLRNVSIPFRRPALSASMADRDDLVVDCWVGSALQAQSNAQRVYVLTDVYHRTTQTLYTTTTPGQQNNQYLRTTTSNGVVYVVVESGAANNGQEVAVVQGGAESLGGMGTVVTALVAGIVVVGVVMIFL